MRVVRYRRSGNDSIERDNVHGLQTARSIVPELQNVSGAGAEVADTPELVMPGRQGDLRKGLAVDSEEPHLARPGAVGHTAEHRSPDGLRAGAKTTVVAVPGEPCDALSIG